MPGPCLLVFFGSVSIEGRKGRWWRDVGSRMYRSRCYGVCCIAHRPGDPEARVAKSGHRPKPMSTCSAAARSIVAPRAAATDPKRTGQRPSGVFGRRLLVPFGVVPILAPFLCVAVHIE